MSFYELFFIYIDTFDFHHYQIRINIFWFLQLIDHVKWIVSQTKIKSLRRRRQFHSLKSTDLLSFRWLCQRLVKIFKLIHFMNRVCVFEILMFKHDIMLKEYELNKERLIHSVKMSFEHGLWRWKRAMTWARAMIMTHDNDQVTYEFWRLNEIRSRINFEDDYIAS